MGKVQEVKRYTDAITTYIKTEISVTKAEIERGIRTIARKVKFTQTKISFLF